jgi:hypothetical protein
MGGASIDALAGICRWKRMSEIGKAALGTSSVVGVVRQGRVASAEHAGQVAKKTWGGAAQMVVLPRSAR